MSILIEMKFRKFPNILCALCLLCISLPKSSRSEMRLDNVYDCTSNRNDLLSDLCLFVRVNLQYYYIFVYLVSGIACVAFR